MKKTIKYTYDIKKDNWENAIDKLQTRIDSGAPLLRRAAIEFVSLFCFKDAGRKNVIQENKHTDDTTYTAAFSSAYKTDGAMAVKINNAGSMFFINYGKSKIRIDNKDGELSAKYIDVLFGAMKYCYDVQQENVKG